MEAQLQNEIKDAATKLISGNKKFYQTLSKQDQIDAVTSHLSYFKEDGISHIQLKNTVAQYVA